MKRKDLQGFVVHLFSLVVLLLSQLQLFRAVLVSLFLANVRSALRLGSLGRHLSLEIRNEVMLPEVLQNVHHVRETVSDDVEEEQEDEETHPSNTCSLDHGVTAGPLQQLNLTCSSNSLGVRTSQGRRGLREQAVRTEARIHTQWTGAG